MISHTNRTQYQFKVPFRCEPVALDNVNSQQFCDAIYKRLALYRFFNHHTVHRITVAQFLAMLAVKRIEKYKQAA